MSKKFGTNPKAQEAREKEKQQKQEKRRQEEEQKESQKWVETDKNILKKQARQDEKEDKKAEEQRKKEEKKQLYEEEMNSVKDNRQQKDETKLTKAEIKKREEDALKKALAKKMGIDLDEQKQIKKDREKEYQKQKKEQQQNQQEGQQQEEEEEQKRDPNEYYESEDDLRDLPKNLNHIRREQQNQDQQNYHKVIDATGLDDAIDALDQKSGVKHPEKKAKAAYEAFLDRRLPELKKEYPEFKRSKHLEILKKEWDKSPENPFNQNVLQYNQK